VDVGPAALVTIVAGRVMWPTAHSAVNALLPPGVRCVERERDHRDVFEWMLNTAINRRRAQPIGHFHAIGGDPDARRWKEGSREWPVASVQRADGPRPLRAAETYRLRQAIDRDDPHNRAHF
jgi:hypothetical protein